MFALEEEMALAHIFLRERRSTGASSVEITTPLVVVRGAVTSMKADAVAEQSVPGAAEAAPLLTVERWSDLAIGVAMDGRYVALAPAPAIGERFRISMARELHLPGNRWRGVLEQFARSADGRSITRAEMMRALDLLAPPGRLAKDGRAHPAALEAGIMAEMHVMANKANEKLHCTLGDLRSELRNQVDGPKQRHLNFLRVDGDHIDSVFVVAYLVPGERGEHFFGPPRS